MVVIYCYLKKENDKILKFHKINLSCIETSVSLSFKLRPPISAALSSFEVKRKYGNCLLEERERLARLGDRLLKLYDT